MATERYINECKNRANANRLAKFELQNWDRAELEGTGDTFQQTEILPNEYTQVDYVRSDGSSYIDTNYVPNSNTRFYIKASTEGVSGHTGLFGSRTSNSNQPILSYIENSYGGVSNSIRIDITGRTGNTGKTWETNVPFEIDIDIPNKKVLVNDEQLTAYNNISYNTSSEVTFSLFAVHTGTNYAYPIVGKIFSCKIYENSVLVRNYIPCYRNSDNVVGMYDIVNNVFYTNQGSGVFTYGSVANIPNPDYPQKIESVTGLQNVEVCGKNMLDYSTLQYGYVNTIGTITEQHPLGEMHSDFIKVRPNTTYTFKIFEISGTEYANWFGVGEYTSNNISSFVRRDTMITETQHYITFTTSATTQYVIVSARNLENATKVQLELGTATSYEPYKGNTYEVNLGNIELNKIGDYKDSIKKSTGKNLFDNNAVTRNKIIGRDTGTTSTNNSYAATDYIPIGENVTFTCTGFNVWYTACYDSNKTYLGHMENSNTMTTIPNTAYIRASILLTNLDLGIGQIELGNQQTSPEPYGKVWYVGKQYNKAIIDGSKGSYSNPSTNRFNIDDLITDFKKSEGYNLSLSNYYKSFNQVGTNAEFNTLVSNENYAFDFSSATSYTLRFKDTRFTNVNDFKTWLSNNNVEVLYKLATPKYEVITNTELINQLETLYEGLQDENAKNVFIDSEDLPIELDMKYFKGGVQIEDDNRFLEINQSNHLVSIELQDSSYVNDTIIGSTFTPSAEVQLLNMPADTEYIGKKIIPKIGVKYAENDVEYETFDSYTIESLADEQTASNTKFTAMNGSTLLDKEYVCSLSFDEGTTHTINEFYQDALSQIGITPLDETFLNSEIELTGNPFTNKESIRTVISEVEKTSCSIAEFNWYNKTASLTWLSDQIDYEFNPSDYSTLEGSLTKYGPVNVVIIANSQLNGENVVMTDAESVAQYGEHQIIIDSPYFLYTEALRSQAIEAIYNRLNGLTYYDLKLITPYGKPFLKKGNKIRINTNENQVFDTYILKHTFKFDGAFYSTIESPALTQEEQTIKNEFKNNSIKERIQRTEVIVDKVEGEIQGITTRVIEVEDGLGNTYTKEETNEAIQTAKDGWTNTFTTNGGNNILKNTGLWFEDNSERKYLYPSNNMYPSDDLYLLAQPYYEYWQGFVIRGKEEKASNSNCLLLQDTRLKQEQQVKNGKYTLSFKYKLLTPLAEVKAIINGKEIELTETNDTEIIETFEVNSQYIDMEFESDADNSCEIYDLMINVGKEKAPYSQNQNESQNNTVNISKGITITSSDTNTTFKADSDGIRVFNSRNMQTPITDFTDTGTKTKKLIVDDEAHIVDLYIQKMSRNTWITKL